MSDFQKQLSCDEARLMINENLDRGAKSEDLINLSHHLQGCDSCDEFLSSLSGFENGLDELRKVYDKLEPDEKLKQSTLNKISDLARDSETRHGSKTFLNGWSGMTIRSHMMTGLSGTFAGVLLWFAIFGLGGNTQESPSRFSLHPMEFHTSADKVAWNHHDVILPGQTLRKTINRDSKNPYHFRLKSSGPVNIVLSHKPLDGSSMTTHHFVLHGVRYASLKEPEKQELIVLRNEGKFPIELHSFAEHENTFDNQNGKNDVKT